MSFIDILLNHALRPTWTSGCSLDRGQTNMSKISAIGVKQTASYTEARTQEASLPSCLLTSTMPATASIPTLSRYIAWFLGKSSRSTSEGFVEDTEELRIPAPTTLQDDSYTYQPQAFNTGAALFTLPQHAPLDLLELSLLCAAQGIAAIPEEPQTPVLRTAVAAAAKVTVVELVQPMPMEVEILLPTPTVSLTPPTPTKRKPKAGSRSFAPLQSAPGTLRPSGKWRGRKHTSRRRAHDQENFAPATPSRPLKTREEGLKSYMPPVRLLGVRQGQESTSPYPTSNRF
ncbi:hypothetical protein CPB85DRAFT_833983 [Mucidula mucida]|nr:hypothetical protein CPB85DRAFT_833983 [Mucidula mucida]